MTYATTYQDHGQAYEAIHIPWKLVSEILGHDHSGSETDDQRLCQYLLWQMDAPAWVLDAAGWVDEYGWGLIGPPNVKTTDICAKCHHEVGPDGGFVLYLNSTRNARVVVHGKCIPKGSVRVSDFAYIVANPSPFVLGWTDIG